MPPDYRRLAVPEGSRPPPPPILREAASLMKDENSRQDGRQSNCLRPLFARVGVVTSARGSAYIEMGKTKVIVSVYGPREIVRREDVRQEGQLCCQFKFATFASRWRRKEHQQDSEEKDLGDVVTKALLPAVMIEEFPKARLDVCVLVLEDDGSCCAAAVTAASLAVAAAGVQMYDLVIAASLRHFDELRLLDPTTAEEQHQDESKQPINDFVLTVAYMSSLKQVSNMIMHGKTQPQATIEDMRLCIEASETVLPTIRDCLAAVTKEST